MTTCIGTAVSFGGSTGFGFGGAAAAALASPSAETSAIRRASKVVARRLSALSDLVRLPKRPFPGCTPGLYTDAAARFYSKLRPGVDGVGVLAS